MGIICVIAETAGANPWDSFVSDQQIFEAQTIWTLLHKGSGANWGQKAKALDIAKNHKMFWKTHSIINVSNQGRVTAAGTDSSPILTKQPAQL